MSKERRTGRGYHWEQEDCSGYAIDDLDTLEIDDVKEAGTFETLFVLTREALKDYKKLDRGFDADLLDVCHHVSRHLSKNKKLLT